MPAKELWKMGNNWTNSTNILGLGTIIIKLNEIFKSLFCLRNFVFSCLRHN